MNKNNDKPPIPKPKPKPDPQKPEWWKPDIVKMPKPESKLDKSAKPEWWKPEALKGN